MTMKFAINGKIKLIIMNCVPNIQNAMIYFNGNVLHVVQILNAVGNQ